MWKQRRMVAAAAAVTALLVAGCGSGSAEPSEKQWEKDDSQSQSESSGKSQKDDGVKGQGSGSSDKDDSSGSKDDEGKSVIRKGDDDAAKRPDKATAAEIESFMSDFLDEMDAATKDGDFSRIDPFVEECSVCSGSRSEIGGLYEEGGKVEGGLFTKSKINVGVVNPDDSVNVNVISTVSAYKKIDASGTVVDKGPAAEQRYRFSVEKQGENWRIVSGRFVQ